MCGPNSGGNRTDNNGVTKFVVKTVVSKPEPDGGELEFVVLLVSLGLLFVFSISFVVVLFLAAILSDDLDGGLAGWTSAKTCSFIG